MGSGLDLSCLTYEKVSAFIIDVNKEFNRKCSPFKNHPITKFLTPTLERASYVDIAGNMCINNTEDIPANSGDIYFFALHDDQNILVFEDSSSVIPAGTRRSIPIRDIMNTMIERYLLSRPANPNFEQNLGDCDLEDGLNGQETLFSDFLNWNSYIIVGFFLLAADTKIPSAADMDVMHWIMYSYFLILGNTNPIKDTNEFLCLLQNIKFVNGTTLDSGCEFLFAIRPFRLFAGSLVSLIEEEGSCWGKACKSAYRVVRAKWESEDTCRPTIERCKYIPAGVYRSLDCKSIYGADEFLSGAALAKITSNQVTIPVE